MLTRSLRGRACSTVVQLTVAMHSGTQNDRAASGTTSHWRHAAKLDPQHADVHFAGRRGSARVRRTRCAMAHVRRWRMAHVRRWRNAAGTVRFAISNKIRPNSFLPACISGSLKTFLGPESLDDGPNSVPPASETASPSTKISSFLGPSSSQAPTAKG